LPLELSGEWKSMTWTMGAGSWPLSETLAGRAMVALRARSSGSLHPAKIIAVVAKITSARMRLSPLYGTF
jgi:hypothetical protein